VTRSPLATSLEEIELGKDAAKKTAEEDTPDSSQ
jgi:hypothetical protein